MCGIEQQAHAVGINVIRKYDCINAYELVQRPAAAEGCMGTENFSIVRMNERMEDTGNLLPYGWVHFDQQIVSALATHPEDAVADTRGGMRSPLIGSDAWLSWAAGDGDVAPTAGNGTVWVGKPPLRFHAPPTYVLQQPIDNFIAGRKLVGQALCGNWGRVETTRLGHENSEHAVTWNVFRALQEAGELGTALHALSGIHHERQEPELYLWGRHIELHAAHAWPALVNARRQVEREAGHQADPACCMHVPGRAWIFFETGFGRKVTAPATSETAPSGWFGLYGESCPGVFNEQAIRSLPSDQCPASLLRNVALALRVRKSGEEIIVVALVRQAEASSIDVIAHRCVNDGFDLKVRMATWEQLYAALPPRAELERLRQYLGLKSCCLRPALAIERPTPPVSDYNKPDELSRLSN